MGAKAQVLSGVNTGTARPNALLEIASSVGQHAKNGVHVPYITSAQYTGTKPNGGAAISKLLGVKDGNIVKNYIYWNGSRWVELLTEKPNTTISRNTTVIFGEGFEDYVYDDSVISENDYFEKFMSARKIKFGNSTNSQVATTAGNVITVKKKGLYKIEVFSGIERLGSISDATYGQKLDHFKTYDGVINWKMVNSSNNGTLTYNVLVKVTNSKYFHGGASHSNSTDAIANIAVGGILQINANQTIEVTVTRSRESVSDQIPIYQHVGYNTLILTKLSE